MRRGLIFPLIFLMLLSFVSAEFPATKVTLDSVSASVEAGGSLPITVTVENGDNKPIIDAYFVFDVVYMDDMENVISEVIKKDINIRAKETLTYEYEIDLPDFARAGKYEVHTYFKTPRTDILGYPEIFMHPISRDLVVTNPGSFSDVRVDRKNTLMCGELSAIDFKEGCYAGQLGPVVQPGAQNTFELAVKNFGDNTEVVRAVVDIFPWDDTQGEKVRTITADFGTLDAGTDATKEIRFTNPSMPGAYSVYISLEGSFGEVISIFRSRFVVEGTSSRIREISPDKHWYAPGEEAKLFFTVSAPADSRSTLSDGNLYVRVKDLNTGRHVYTETKPFEFEQKTYDDEFSYMVNDEGLSTYEVTASVMDGTRDLDTYVFTVTPEKFRVSPTELSVKTCRDPMLEVESDRFPHGRPVYIGATVLNEYAQPVGSEVTLTVHSGELNLGPYVFSDAYSLNLDLDFGTYELRFSSGELSYSKDIEIVNETEVPYLDEGTLEDIPGIDGEQLQDDFGDKDKAEVDDGRNTRPRGDSGTDGTDYGGTGKLGIIGTFLEGLGIPAGIANVVETLLVPVFIIMIIVALFLLLGKKKKKGNMDKKEVKK